MFPYLKGSNKRFVSIINKLKFPIYVMLSLFQFCLFLSYSFLDNLHDIHMIRLSLNLVRFDFIYCLLFVFTSVGVVR